MDFQQIRDFVNPAVAQATGIEPVENLSMPVPVAYVPVQLVIDGALSLTSENPVQNKVIAVAIQQLDGRITAIEGQFSEGVTEAVNNWLAAHPEATTTVQDGAITYAKLDANLKGEVDQISELKSAIEGTTRNLLDPRSMYVGTINNVVFAFSNGKYTLNGTANGSATQYSDDLNLVAGNTYAFCAFADSDENISGYIRSFDSNNTVLQTEYITSTNRPKIITINANATRVVWSIGPNNGTTYNNFEIKFQITEGYSIKTYIEHTTAIDRTNRENTELLSKNFNQRTVSLMTELDFEFIGNYYPAADGGKAGNANYYWYEFVAEDDFDIWTDSNMTTSTDTFIAIYNNGTVQPYNFIVRLRNDTLPTSSNKYSIKKGQLVVVSLYKSQAFTVHTDGNICGVTLSDIVHLSKRQVSQIDSKKINVTVGSGVYTIEMNGYTIPIKQTINSGTRANLWNIQKIEKNGVVIVPEGTDIIGVLNENGESDFMGGVHGDETNVNFYILADGKPILQDVTCDVVDILMYSHLTRVSSGNNIIDRYVHIVFKDGTIIIETTFKCLVDSFNLKYAYNGGMFAWYDAEADFAMTNMGVIDTSGITAGTSLIKNKELYSASAIIANGIVSCENIIGRENDSYKGEAFYYGNEANPRLKMYYSTEDNTIWNTGHICKGKAVYTLN